MSGVPGYGRLKPRSLCPCVAEPVPLLLLLQQEPQIQKTKNKNNLRASSVLNDLSESKWQNRA